MRLDKNWTVLQDVHNTGELIGLYREHFQNTLIAHQMSEWEPIDELKHLQLVFSQQPYFGRELRQFNNAPWWYKNSFELPKNAGSNIRLHFSNVDYYCKVWLNGVFLGEHEGYCVPFSFDIGGIVRRGGSNTLIVKVWSPWDSRVAGEQYELRAFMVVRNMVKGTYEHDDGLIPRDVNPVGIYGSVSIECSDNPVFQRNPEIKYDLDLSTNVVNLSLTSRLNFLEDCTLELSCCDALTGTEVLKISKRSDGGEISIGGSTKPIIPWTTWDRGERCLYDVSLKVYTAGGKTLSFSQRLGFRRTEFLRNKNETALYLNGERLYIRGTSYFPDVYVSAMCRERYLRDLLLIKAAGFNLVRVHVHVELDIFYELCSELGIAVMQDSEYNWTHPAEPEFGMRFERIFRETILNLSKYPAVVCWICLNEPDYQNVSGLGCSLLNSGLYERMTKLAPNTAFIKGSFCHDDLQSGDSHNYLGSIDGENTHYSDIYGSLEKLNTEYGFDAPCCENSLRALPQIYERLKRKEPELAAIREYQYALLKYYTEHYRMQKYAPNSGYVQFLFNDLCPQSYYGICDYWGIPKPGYDALLESGQPIGIFLKYKERLDAVYAVNDYPYGFGKCLAEWILRAADGGVLLSGKTEFELGADCCVKLCSLDGWTNPSAVNATLLLTDDSGRLLARNFYSDLFNMPNHPKGHPDAISHELGVRLYE